LLVKKSDKSDAMINELSTMIAPRRNATELGGPDAAKLAIIEAKKSDALGLRIFVKKPVFIAASGLISVCADSAWIAVIARALRSVFMPRYARYAAPKNLMILNRALPDSRRTEKPMIE